MPEGIWLVEKWVKPRSWEHTVRLSNAFSALDDIVVPSSSVPPIPRPVRATDIAEGISAGVRQKRLVDKDRSGRKARILYDAMGGLDNRAIVKLFLGAYGAGMQIADDKDSFFVADISTATDAFLSFASFKGFYIQTSLSLTPCGVAALEDFVRGQMGTLVRSGRTIQVRERFSDNNTTYNLLINNQDHSPEKRDYAVLQVPINPSQYGITMVVEHMTGQGRDKTVWKPETTNLEFNMYLYRLLQKNYAFFSPPLMAGR
ncbi:MAG TPA: hypothetical protein VJH97_04790 [Candidatus Nanoarchaeia archaeon]|nr:hypothetical protein [Candidatus Nanoarchaeia archaeon]